MRLVLAVLICTPAVAEESATFTLETGVAISEQSELPADTIQSVRIQKTKSGYDVFVNAFFGCSGKFSQPWLGVAENPTLVIQKEKSASPFHHGEECMYRLKISVADRLTSKQTLYVVSNQEVVGHVGVP